MFSLFFDWILNTAEVAAADIEAASAVTEYPSGDSIEKDT